LRSASLDFSESLMRSKAADDGKASARMNGQKTPKEGR
jgi:hypothetical protein